MMSGVVVDFDQSHRERASSGALRGIRALLVGTPSRTGCSIAETLASAGCDLFLPKGDIATGNDAAWLSAIAPGLTIVETAGTPLKAAQQAARRAGRLDCAVTVTEVEDEDLTDVVDMMTLEARLALKLAAAIETTRVVANRMGLTWTDGAIVNVLVLPPGRDGGFVAMLLKDAIARFTRAEAARWSDTGVTIQAVVGVADPGPGTPAIAELVAGLVAGTSAALSGVTFTARTDAA